MMPHPPDHSLAAMAATIVRLYQEGDELRAEVAMLQQQARILAGEQVVGRWTAEKHRRNMEALAMALVKTIKELEAEKAELSVKLVNLEGRSRRATLDEIAESVREKHDPEYQFGGDQNE